MENCAYLDLLLAARASEAEAIALYLKVIDAAPEEDVAKITEIVNDENQHSVIVGELILNELTQGRDNGSV